MLGDVQSRMKTDMRRVREFTADVLVVDSSRVRRTRISARFLLRARSRDAAKGEFLMRSV